MTSHHDNHANSEEFLEAARRGDAHAWEKIMADYRPYLFKVALSRCPDSECSIVVQESWETAFAHIKQFSGHTRKELRAWLARIVSNHAVDRQRKKKPVQPLNSTPEVAAEPIDTSTPSRKVIRDERDHRLLNAIDKLPPDNQEVVRLRYFQKLKYDEIATRMDRSNVAVRKLLTRSIRLLGKFLAEEP
jgi:RNA polymerase sigma factor (sigma-70 family)